ncbi:2-hydroxyacid dehydrogenase [Aporhodopirellula aestuarii]|uniref:D-glycerate dehydrogenase n=1 Tax=Aporhodopirellula aestuarii TaxID=2950107 RepID=A0ABT0U3S6_9BACT|nr:D-glycerate dehydrogenase [Aporhodopirellula aestuarii]MCM2371563.1 D-glycerate dehydrogenase [Aporhodopirellula aestuarii]
MTEPTRRRIFVTRQIPGAALDRLCQLHDVSIWPDRVPPTPTELLERVAGCDGLLTMLSDRIDESVMKAAGPQLKVVSNYAVGYNNIDLVAARERGIRVGNTPDVLSAATADLAVTLLLAAARLVPEASAQVREGRWGAWEPDVLLGVEPAGRTLGVIGMGRIGKTFAERMVGGWGMKLLYTSRAAKQDVDESLGGRHVEIDELLRESDFISLHVALNDETRHLIDADAFAKMKSTAVIVNTARGEIIDQEALVDAIRNKQIFAAGLDVTTPEPLPPTHPLVGLPNVLILPHIGSATDTSRHAMSEIAVDNVLAGLSDSPLRCEVPLA